MTHSRDRSAGTGSTLGGAFRRILRSAVLVLVFLLVASIGLVIGKQSPDAEPSATELALDAGAVTAHMLAESATLLEESGLSGDTDPAAMAEMLQLHASALQPAARSTAPASPAFSPAESLTPSATASESSAVPSLQDFAADLTGSYTRTFEAAALAESGPARVLASVATAQWLQSRALARYQETAAPELSFPEEHDDDGPVPQCPSDTTPVPDRGLDGARTAVLAEQRASYVYEVAAARAADPALLLARMAQHEHAANQGARILAGHCIAEPLPAAAYALDATFLSDPLPALAELEDGLLRTYSDLVGVSEPGTVRDWAIRQLAGTALHLAESNPAGSGSALSVFPGIDPREYPRPPQPGS